MTMNKGTRLAIEGTVDGDTYDVPQGAGYGVTTQVTVEGTPGEKAIMDGIWDSILGAGDRPVYVKATLTWAGHEWPWTKVISKFDVEYQAVHMAEGSILAGLGVLIITLLPLMLEFIFIILKAVAITYVILKALDVAEWLAKEGPAVVAAAGIGAGVVILALILLGGDNK
ncbi:hypothetical protein ES703_43624 [subsurface metagenome]